MKTLPPLSVEFKNEFLKWLEKENFAGKDGGTKVIQIRMGAQLLIPVNQTREDFLNENEKAHLTKHCPNGKIKHYNCSRNRTITTRRHNDIKDVDDE